MADATELRTVRQLAEELRATGAFSEPSLRWLIFNSQTNGLDEALIRVGRRVFIDRQAFSNWLAKRR